MVDVQEDTNVHRQHRSHHFRPSLSHTEREDFVVRPDAAVRLDHPLQELHTAHVSLITSVGQS